MSVDADLNEKVHVALIIIRRHGGVGTNHQLTVNSRCQEDMLTWGVNNMKGKQYVG